MVFNLTAYYFHFLFPQICNSKIFRETNLNQVWLNLLAPRQMHLAEEKWQTVESWYRAWTTARPMNTRR